MTTIDTMCDAIDMRCQGTMHAILRPDGLIEVKCHHIRCTKGKNVNVFHYFDPLTGELIDTRTYKDPIKGV